MVEEISNEEAIIGLVMREARARTKVDYSKAVIEVLWEVMARCSTILDQGGFIDDLESLKESENRPRRGGD